MNEERILRERLEETQEKLLQACATVDEWLDEIWDGVQYAINRGPRHDEQGVFRDAVRELKELPERIRGLQDALMLRRLAAPLDPVCAHLASMMTPLTHEERLRIFAMKDALDRLVHPSFKCIQQEGQDHEQSAGMDRDHERKPDAQEVRGEPARGDGTAGTDTEGP